ncbi:MAG TPA: GNAT family N-acetyltransferase [Acidobacteriaceae bacterium]|nr:GNAT family N-acetyltransferase [Acidobacteriaceae bacterium]
MEFRGYRPDDFEAMFRLDEACFGPPFRFSRATMRRFAEAKKARVVVAEQEGLAGFCVMHVERVPGGCVGYIVTLDVAVAFRRRGLAAELMRRVEDTAREAGCQAMALHVSVGNDGAIRFYERCGYERSARAEGFYGKGGDAWIYRKALSVAEVNGGEWGSFPR